MKTKHFIFTLLLCAFASVSFGQTNFFEYSPPVSGTPDPLTDNIRRSGHVYIGSTVGYTQSYNDGYILTVNNYLGHATNGGIHVNGSNGDGIHSNSTNGYALYGFSQNSYSGYFQGKVNITDHLQIGLSQPYNLPAGYRLYVKDGILTEKVKVAIENTADWSDYVFDPNYQLMPLNELKTFINQNCHLPNVPSANEVVNNGIDLAKMDAVLLEKIEELYLYVIELKEENIQLINDIAILKEKR